MRISADVVCFVRHAIGYPVKTVVVSVDDSGMALCVSCSARSVSIDERVSESIPEIAAAVDIQRV